MSRVYLVGWTKRGESHEAVDYWFTHDIARGKRWPREGVEAECIWLTNQEVTVVSSDGTKSHVCAFDFEEIEAGDCLVYSELPFEPEESLP